MRIQRHIQAHHLCMDLSVLAHLVVSLAQKARRLSTTALSGWAYATSLFTLAALFSKSHAKSVTLYSQILTVTSNPRFTQSSTRSGRKSGGSIHHLAA